MDNEIIKIVNESGLESSTANTLQNAFIPFFEQAKEWESKAKLIEVTDASQKDIMKQAREGRLFLRNIRIEADKKRKELKEDSIRYGKAIQGLYNVIEYLIVPIEKHLEKQENFIEIQETKRKTEIKETRESELRPFSEFVPFGIDLSIMDEVNYQKLFNGAKLQYQQKIELEKKLEEERILKEKAESEERERIRLENEKLKKEAVEREKKIAKEKAEQEKLKKIEEEKLKKEREENDKKLKEEQLAKRKLEEEIQKKNEEEERQLAEIKRKEEEEKQKREAPEKEKLLQLSNDIDSIFFPEIKNEDMIMILNHVKNQLKLTSDFIKGKINVKN